MWVTACHSHTSEAGHTASESCEQTHDHEAESHDHEGESHNHEGEQTAAAPNHSGEIVFTKEQAARTDFALYEVQPTTFHEVIRTGGRILSAQGDEMTVVAPVSGIVTFSSRRMTDGAEVSKGATLLTLSSREMAEGDYVARTRATYEQAQAAYQRAEGLAADQIISKNELEQRRLAYEQARLAFEALSSRSGAEGTRVVAPLGGYLKNIAVREGDFVEAGMPLATVSQNRRLQLRAEVSQRYLPLLRNISGANLKMPYEARIYRLDSLQGRLLSVGKSSDEGTVYIPVIFEFNNSGNLLPGAFAEVYLLTTPQPHTLTVPLSAVAEDQGVYFVFVQLDEEGYLKREVKLGADDGVSVQVLSGLAPGEKVVSRGVAQVKMASFSGAIPHGHSH